MKKNGKKGSKLALRLVCVLMLAALLCGMGLPAAGAESQAEQSLYSQLMACETLEEMLDLLDRQEGDISALLTDAEKESFEAYLNEKLENGEWTEVFAEVKVASIIGILENSENDATVYAGPGGNGGGNQGGNGGGNQGGNGGGNQGGNGGNRPGDDNNQECDISYYNSNSIVYWDTMSYSASSGSANHSAYTNIESVLLNGANVVNADSGSTNWPGGSGISTYFPSASTTNDQSVTLTITPKAGYYVTHVVVACTSQGQATPYSCNTWNEGNAYDLSLIHISEPTRRS